MSDNWVSTIIILIIGFIFFLVMSGCSLLRPIVCTTPTVVPDSPENLLLTMLAKHNWLITGSILGIALSVVAFVNGSKFAIPVFIGACTALGTTLAVVRYAPFIAIAAIILAGVTFVLTVFRKNKAIKEIVTGVQRIKDGCVVEDRDEVNGELQAVQSKSTKKIVRKVKNGNKT